MKTMLLVLVCGSTMSLAAAMQPANQPDRRSGEQPSQTNPAQPRDNQPRDTQPRDTQPRENQPGRITSIDRTTLRSQPDALLQKLEGMWKVDVTVSPEFWAEHHGGPQMRTPGDRTTTPVDPARPQNPADRDGTTSRPGNDQKPGVPGQPDRDQPDRTNQPGQPATSGQPGSISSSTGFTGFAQTRLIMGGQILEETIRIPNMAMGGPGAMKDHDATRTTDRDTTRDTTKPSGISPDRTNQPSSAPGQPDRDNDRTTDRDAPTPRDRDINSPTRTGGMGTGGMVGRMFLSFDEGSKNYTVVFMENQSGKIHTDTGTFDATSNRIVFHGDGHKGDKKDGMKDNAGNSGNSGNRAMHDDRSTRIVLELTGDDRYTVTMYRDSGTSTRPGTTTNNNPNQPGNNNQPGQPGARTGDTNRNDQMGAMVYRATYTKLSGTDIDRARDVLRTDEPGRIGADRTTPAGTNPNNR